MTRKQLPGLNGIPCGEGKAEDVKSTRWGVQNLAHPGHHQHHKSWDTGWTDFVDQSIGSRVYRGKFFPISCVRLPNSAAHRGKFSTKLLDVLLCLCLWCLLLLPESLTFRHLSRTLSTVSQKPPVPDWLTSARPLCFSLHDLLLFRWSLLLLLSNVKSHSSCASQESGCLFCLCFFLFYGRQHAAACHMPAGPAAKVNWQPWRHQQTWRLMIVWQLHLHWNRNTNTLTQ